ncbi:MAG: glycosyltransferase N-terminal domain-containing protein [Bacteroidota bacterium]|nr:glycosyltransferase N-terminal domain-containing protein [Bacteroidota bacterium]
MFPIYNLAIRAYAGAVRLASLFDPKAAKWVRGRIDWENKLGSIIRSKENYIWVHCASLGEFEQGRPVIEALKKEYPGHSILLSFFSPSGFEIKKNDDQVDGVVYLPLDTVGNARRFLDIVRPDFAIFVKYEFWFNFMRELNRRDIPVFVVSAIFRKDQHFFKAYGGWFRKQLKKISWIFVQNDDSLKLLQEYSIENASKSGDTRFDRVADIARNSNTFPEVEKFVKGYPVLLAGSTWPPGEKLVKDFLAQDKSGLKVIIAPHEVHEDRIRDILEKFPGMCVRFSKIDERKGDERILIIDSIGILSQLYKYADLAYIGGGFGAGIHNILEAATFGKAVLFGPRYKKFKEARDLVELEGAFPVKNAAEFSVRMNGLLNDKKQYERACSICEKYTRENQGATRVILQKINLLMSGES